MELIIFIGYILWTIFITEGSEFNDKQLDTYIKCAFVSPVPAFLLVYLLGVFMFGVKDGDTGLFAISVSAAYLSPLFEYQIIQWFNQFDEFIKRIREHRRLVRECEQMSELAKQEEIRKRKQKIYQHLAKQMANCSTPHAKFSVYTSK